MSERYDNLSKGKHHINYVIAISESHRPETRPVPIPKLYHICSFSQLFMSRLYDKEFEKNLPINDELFTFLTVQINCK